MATLTVFAETPEVRIFFGMTCCAAGRGPAEMGPGGVAPSAIGLGMTANKRIIGKAVIEGRSIKPHQSKAASMMVTVTGFAGLSASAGLSVKSSTCLHVARNTFVTGKAFAVLSLMRK